MKRTILFAVAAALTMALVSPAAADPISTQPTHLSVNHADLNLSQAEDASALLRRFRGAARMTCGDTPAMRSLIEKSHIRSCVRTSMEHAVSAANSSTVSDIYYGRRATVMVTAMN